MADIFICDTCSSPWMEKKDHPAIWDSLDHLPIGWCPCPEPVLVPMEYAQGEFREIYYLALSSTMPEDGEDISVLLDEEELQLLQWVKRKEENWWLTTKGRKLLPLCLIVASDLHSS